MNYAGLVSIALPALLRNKIRGLLTVLGITIGIAAVICVDAIGNAGQKRVEHQLNNLGDNFVWIEAGSRAVNGVVYRDSRLRTMKRILDSGTHKRARRSFGVR